PPGRPRSASTTRLTPYTNRLSLHCGRERDLALLLLAEALGADEEAQRAFHLVVGGGGEGNVELHALGGGGMRLGTAQLLLVEFHRRTRLHGQRDRRIGRNVRALRRHHLHLRLRGLALLHLDHLGRLDAVGVGYLGWRGQQQREGKRQHLPI